MIYNDDSDIIITFIQYYLPPPLPVLVLGTATTTYYFLPAKLLYDGLFFANKSIKAFLISNSNSSPTNVGG